MNASLTRSSGRKKLHACIEYPETEDQIYELKFVVSRKKQLLPYLTHLLSQT